ncbi:MAG: hypothetical protein AAF512_17690 [Pseudomonadota bacterium]
MTHLCHAEGCQEAVPPKLLMCRRHWRMVPAELQQAVWQHYRKGQERDKRPTRDYLSAAQAAIRAVAVSEGLKPAVSGRIDTANLDTTPGSGSLFAAPDYWDGDVAGYVEVMRERWKSDREWQQRAQVAAWLWMKRQDPKTITGPVAKECEQILRSIATNQQQRKAA